jgi:hypothetical protein
VTTKAEATAPKVLCAIVDVMAALGKEGIGKDRENTSGPKFKYRGIDEVLNALAPLLAQHRLIITPRCVARTCEERRSNSGGALFVVTVEVEYQLTSAEDGSHILARTFGEAMDSGDKATNKAMSAAYKYMAVQQFCIPTEGDNDADAHTHAVAPRQPANSAARTERAPAPADRKPGEVTPSVTACQAQINIIETEGELRAWSDKHKAFIQKLDEDEYAQVLAFWKARMETIRAPAQSDPFTEADPVKAMEAGIDACATRVDLDRWADANKAALETLDEAPYAALLARWKARHAALAPRRAA